VPTTFIMSMVLTSLFDPLKKLLNLGKTVTDNYAFRLHYKITVTIFMLFTILVTAKQFFGDPINCLVEGVPDKIVNVYCWVTGTFTIPELAVNQDRLAYPGIGTYNKHYHTKTYHKYYQWVCFVVFGQALMFYLPRHIWTMIEGGRMKFIVAGLKEFLADEEAINKNVEKLEKNYAVHRGYRNNFYAYKFFFCEFLNFVNVVFQILLTNRFLGGLFMEYGSRYLQAHALTDKDIDPVHQVFPKVTKCEFAVHTPSGDIKESDALCVLPLNIVNEKIYLVMWVWLMFLVVLSSISLLYRTAVICLPSVRTLVFFHTNNSSKAYDIRAVCSHVQLGDWFVLRLIQKNVEERVFARFLERLAVEMKSHNGGKNMEMGGNNNGCNGKVGGDHSLDTSTLKVEKENIYS